MFTFGKSDKEKITDIMNSKTSRDEKIKALRASGIQPSSELGAYANACLNIVNSKVNANDLRLLESQENENEYNNVMSLYVNENQSTIIEEVSQEAGKLAGGFVAALGVAAVAFGAAMLGSNYSVAAPVNLPVAPKPTDSSKEVKNAATSLIEAEKRQDNKDDTYQYVPQETVDIRQVGNFTKGKTKLLSAAKEKSLSIQKKITNEIKSRKLWDIQIKFLQFLQSRHEKGYHRNKPDNDKETERLNKMIREVNDRDKQHSKNGKKGQAPVTWKTRLAMMSVTSGGARKNLNEAKNKHEEKLRAALKKVTDAQAKAKNAVENTAAAKKLVERRKVQENPRSPMSR